MSTLPEPVVSQAVKPMAEPAMQSVKANFFIVLFLTFICSLKKPVPCLNDKVRISHSLYTSPNELNTVFKVFFYFFEGVAFLQQTFFFLLRLTGRLVAGFSYSFRSVHIKSFLLFLKKVEFSAIISHD